jgi:hypothetical protein
MQDTVADIIIPPLFDTILQDYSSSVPEAREPKVLSLLSITIFSLQVSLLYTLILISIVLGEVQEAFGTHVRNGLYADSGNDQRRYVIVSGTSSQLFPAFGRRNPQLFRAVGSIA